MATIYLAGGLFNAGERVHNLFLAHSLELLGHKVILPQSEDIKFFASGKPDLAAIAEYCKAQCTNPGFVYVGSSDGTDADSGTSVEYGMAIMATGRAVIYRTDFRTAVESEVGLNAMFKLKKTIFVYYPCLIVLLDDIEPYYIELAKKIHEAVISILA